MVEGTGAMTGAAGEQPGEGADHAGVRRGPHLDWAVAGRAMPGEPVSGDAATVRVDGDRHLLAVADGAGHGAAAAAAAARAVAAVEGEPVRGPDELLRTAHGSLFRSRGAALTVGVLDGPTGVLRWLGVGGVDGVVLRHARGARSTSQAVLLRGGVLGHDLPDLPEPAPLGLEDGDCVVLATDGIRAELAELAHHGAPVDRLARDLVERHAAPSDDALVLVARYRSRRLAGGG